MNILSNLVSVKALTTLKSPLFFLFSLALFLVSCGAQKRGAKSNPATTIQTKYAKLLDVKAEQIDNTPLYKFIDQWYGVPYQYAGKSKKGVDCSGFSSILQREIYQRNIAGSSASIFKQCQTVGQKNLKEGDLVFFKIQSKKISHMGVYLQNNKFVHASTKKGVMINDLNEAYYQKYFYKGGRLK